MAHVVVRASLGVPGPQREDRLGAVEGLDLSLLVYAQDQGPSGGFRYRPTMSRTFSTNRG